jgi:hypothetical protein
MRGALRTEPGLDDAERGRRAAPFALETGRFVGESRDDRDGRR